MLEISKIEKIQCALASPHSKFWEDSSPVCPMIYAHDQPNFLIACSSKQCHHLLRPASFCCTHREAEARLKLEIQLKQLQKQLAENNDRLSRVSFCYLLFCLLKIFLLCVQRFWFFASHLPKAVELPAKMVSLWEWPFACSDSRGFVLSCWVSGILYNTIYGRLNVSFSVTMDSIHSVT